MNSGERSISSCNDCLWQCWWFGFWCDVSFFELGDPAAPKVDPDRGVELK
jgi:hypothetical protein